MAKAKSKASKKSIVVVPKYSLTKSKQVWLTFDDGPHKKHTPKALKVLADQGVKATFFVVGRNVVNAKSLVKEIFDAGHLVSNHSYTHANLTSLNKKQIESEIKKTEDAIGDYMSTPKLFRPPYGARNATVDQVSQKMKYKTELWNVDTLDWKKTYQPDRWVQHGIDQIRDRDNSLVLMHDIHKTTVGNLDDFITRIKSIGNVKFVNGFNPSFT